MMSLGVIGANRRRGAAAWTPASYFTGGVDGAYYDMSDLSTLFQDSAGTVAVTTTGDPVGKILDKSGNGYHLIRLTDDNWRAVYTTGGGAGGSSPYLDFDGASSGYQTAAFTSKSQPHFLGISGKIDNTGINTQFTDGSGASNRAALIGLSGQFYINGGTAANTGLTNDTNNVVLTALLSGASSVGYKDGTASSTLSAGTQAFTALTVGCAFNSSTVLDGRIYAFMWIPTTPDATLRANITTWLGSKQGRTL